MFGTHQRAVGPGVGTAVLCPDTTGLDNLAAALRCSHGTRLVKCRGGGYRWR
ncbi:hypothetical protein [Micromonospora sp. LOL_023]|uniref:hypothetical protein n=1 Tax=Micromonospora sp. LOL_023 TaxID=3345418 RepID=UPI003A88C963